MEKKNPVKELKDFAERQRSVYKDIQKDPEAFEDILSEDETREDWLFEELNTLLNMIDKL